MTDQDACIGGPQTGSNVANSFQRKSCPRLQCVLSTMAPIHRGLKGFRGTRIVPQARLRFSQVLLGNGFCRANACRKLQARHCGYSGTSPQQVNAEKKIHKIVARPQTIRSFKYSNRLNKSCLLMKLKPLLQQQLKVIRRCTLPARNAPERDQAERPAESSAR